MSGRPEHRMLVATHAPRQDHTAEHHDTEGRPNPPGQVRLSVTRAVDIGDRARPRGRTLGSSAAGAVPESRWASWPAPIRSRSCGPGPPDPPRPCERARRPPSGPPASTPSEVGLTGSRQSSEPGKKPPATMPQVGERRDRSGLCPDAAVHHHHVLLGWTTMRAGLPIAGHVRGRREPRRGL